MKTSCPHCGRKDEHEFVGSHFLGGWFRCRCGRSWCASLLASALARRRSATGSTHIRPAAATPAEESQTSLGGPPRVRGHDDQGLADDLETWVDSTEGEFSQRRLAQKQPEMLSAILNNPAIAAQPIVENPPPEGAARATRYRVSLPLQYRREGAPEWYSGFTENLSRSGMLFRFSEDPLGLAEEGSEHRRLELSLKLHRVGSGAASSPIRCLSAVVRFESPGKSRTQPAVAVAFDAYR